MTTTADWIVVTGFLLAVLGVSLRIVILMRSNEAAPLNAKPMAGRELMRNFRTLNPKSRLPWLMWASLALGLILLIAGYLLEFR